jgi:fatty-acyl-CoA synthase
VDSRLDAEFFVSGTPDGKKWANTGDLGCVDADGFAWLFGRSKDLIIRGGHNIDPKLIEEVLACHPAVQIAAAIGRPDADKGEMPIAYVQLKPGSQADSAELLQFCRERVQERAAVPTDIIIIPEIPMTAVGKISKPALRINAMLTLSRKLAVELVGDGGSVDVSIDESGLRPKVILHARLASGDPSTVEGILKDAFRSYEFTTSIRVTKTP